MSVDPSKWLCIQDRASRRWFVVREMPWRYEKWTDYGGRLYGRGKKRTRAWQDGYVVPKPEAASPFVKAHRIVDARSAEEALTLCPV